MAEHIGFVGLGRMGGPMAKNLVRNQMSLVLYDISDVRMDDVAGVGGRKAGSVAELAAETDIVVTMLPGPPEVEAVLCGAEGVLGNLKKGGLVLDMSTVLPQTTDALADACAEAGAEFVDAPVGRLASHAEKGESLFMVGASDAGFERVKPLLEAMGTTIHRCGGPGAGTRTKLVNNFLAITSCMMNAEAMALSQAFGLDLPTTLDVIHGTTATNGQLKINYATKVFQDDTVPGFAIDLAHKDLSLILDSANREQVPLPIVAAARESLSQARAGGWGGKDFSALCDFWCERAGVEKARLGD